MKKETWEVVYDRFLFRLRTELAPDGMPPVCIIEHGWRMPSHVTAEGWSPRKTTAQPIEMHG